MKKGISNVFIFVIILWLVKIFDTVSGFEMYQLGILPRELSGLKGILFSPFIHANYFHLISNTLPVFVLMFLLVTFYKKDSLKVIIGSIIFGGLLVWVFGRPAYHIGASGLIYSLATFIVFRGIFNKKISSLIISFVVIISYGGLIWGILPGRFYISWEGHLFGAIVGGILAYRLKKSTN